MEVLNAPQSQDVDMLTVSSVDNEFSIAQNVKTLMKSSISLIFRSLSIFLAYLSVGHLTINRNIDRLKTYLANCMPGRKRAKFYIFSNHKNEYIIKAYCHIH